MRSSARNLGRFNSLPLSGHPRALFRRSAVSAAATVVAILLFVLESALDAAAASSPSSCPFPLENGTRWLYAGQVKWTVPNSAKAKRARVEWTSEVVECFKGPQAQAAVVRGFPDELAWYEPGSHPGFHVLVSVTNGLYHFSAHGKKQAEELARRLSRNPRSLSTAEQLLQWPLVVGRKWGQEADRDDTWYGWYVERAEKKRLSVQGVDRGTPAQIFRLAYRTCPDHQLMDIVPGLGITRFVYSHHGTVASADVRLIACHRPSQPGRPPTQPKLKAP